MNSEDVEERGPWAGGGTTIMVLDALGGCGGQAPMAGMGAGRVAWVSLVSPRRALGWLLDEDEYEGAWLEGDGRARFRLAGREEEADVPVVATDSLALRWLAGELRRRLDAEARPAATVAGAALAA